MKEFDYKINGNSYKVIVNKSEGNVIDLEVNGTPYTVEIEQEEAKAVNESKQSQPKTSSPAASETKTARPASGGNATIVKSPLPGIVIDIKCKVGDTVRKGQPIMILEAMKMENNVLANANGVVKEILVHKNDPVLEGADLLVIE
jgi:biotin carboxyl carrier protein